MLFLRGRILKPVSPPFNPKKLNPMLTRQELLLAAEMLSLASNTFSNHGSNDLDEFVLKLVEDEEALCARVRAWNGDPDGEWPERAEMIGDSSLMHYLSDQLKGWAESLASKN